VRCHSLGFELHVAVLGSKTINTRNRYREFVRYDHGITSEELRSLGSPIPPGSPPVPGIGSYRIGSVVPEPHESSTMH
jgi:hypothetical protein